MLPPSFVALVPVKPPARGKSRLAELPDARRRDLAAAFALDTVRAARAADLVGAVLAVTDDFRFADELAASGCHVVPDGVSGDLNASLVQAAAEAHRRWPDLAPAALCADLPALVPADLDAALSAARSEHGAPAFVPDAAGTGTTMYTADAHRFRPRFGPGSRDRHLAAGARELRLDVPTLRRDVDDLADLDEALRLGVGPYTAHFGPLP
ncbi:2-phospho-L-lactate guanylyltransferase [Nocardioides sp.]|uniref:2-phospho-L-lactate guanylyltransferase n=1 Tax=Nocardioides sp. TaxID=35761 RepID=UPI00273769DA|nr:2-phospho-L-lactate guanylyltransferase [Nocardioides sp.]MDP3890521.1 2-phospho-L-lactate guanylyltransferase [Nocardioides sp.]